MHFVPVVPGVSHGSRVVCAGQVRRRCRNEGGTAGWWPPVPCPRTFPNEPRQLTLAQARSITSSPRLPVRVRSDHRDTRGARSRQRKVGWTHRFRRAVRAPGENPKMRARSLRNASLPLPLWGERGSGSPPADGVLPGSVPVPGRVEWKRPGPPRQPHRGRARRLQLAGVTPGASGSLPVGFCWRGFA